ncbi:hypothetical protein GCM10008949_49100 [Deinococcus humi]|nr:hypothetical protein GCM10008949_49100 [Deinococcus humi]
MVWTLALLATVGYGALYYAQPLLAVAFENAYGWNRAQTSLAFTLALLTAGLAPALGRILDAGQGGRWLGAGALLGSLAFALLALMSFYPLFEVVWLLAGVAMGLTFYEAVFTVLGQQAGASARQSDTLIVTPIAGLASTVFVPLTAALLGLSALLLLIGLLVWRAVPDRAPSTPSSALKAFTPGLLFGRLAMSFTLSRIVTVSVGLQLAPLLLAAGHPPAVTAGLTGLLGLAALPGRIVFLPLLRRLAPDARLDWSDGRRHSSPPLRALHRTQRRRNRGVRPRQRRADASPGRTACAALPGGLFGTVNRRLARPVNLAQAVTPFGVGLLYTWSGGFIRSLLVGLAALAGWSLIGQGFPKEADLTDAPIS